MVSADETDLLFRKLSELPDAEATAEIRKMLDAYECNEAGIEWRILN